MLLKKIAFFYAAATQSLKGQYLVVSFISAFIFLLVVFLAQISLNTTSQSSEDNIRHRIHLQQQSKEVRDSVWDAFYYLGSHAIVRNENNIVMVNDNIKRAINKINTIKRHSQIKGDQFSNLKKIVQDLKELEYHASVVIKLRDQPDVLYPAISIARSPMLEVQIKFMNLMALSIDEYESLDDKGEHVLIIVLLETIRYRWVQMVSTYRMFLVNKLASMSKKSLQPQIDSVDVLYRGIKKNIKDLQAIDESNDLEIQTSESIDPLVTSVDIWHGAFKKVTEFKNDDYWRIDFPIINGTIEPLIKNILEKIQFFDSYLERLSEDDINNLSNTGAEIAYWLWFVCFLGLILLFVGYYYFNSTVLRPLALLSYAMHDEAKQIGQFKAFDFNPKSTETKNLVGAFTILQRQVSSRQKELEHQSLHDDLTGLPNRLLLVDRLLTTINSSKRNNQQFAFIMMDLDRFKDINDTLGHSAGDELLKVISERLCSVLREVDTVARLGGDEFAILIPECDIDHAALVINKIQSTQNQAISVSNQSLYVKASLGVTMYPEHGEDVGTLLKHSDVAMYVSKRNNTSFEFYDASQDKQAFDKLTLRNELQRALSENTLVLFFQPQIDLLNNNIIGAEVLLRWPHPEKGYISPDQFIPIAEKTGIIQQVTEWVISAAIQQQQLWKEKGIDVFLNLNLSAWNLLDPDLTDSILDKVKQYNASTDRLAFEITESAMMTDTVRVIDVLKHMNSVGLALSIDDYGTGFSSLAYLNKFPVSELKIDKSFVIGMDKNDSDAMIVKSTIDLAHNLGLKVVAEGVENSESIEMLKALGCDIAQGFFISKPKSEKEFIRWVEEYLVENKVKLV